MTDESAAEATPPADPAPGGEPRESSPADPELITRRVLLYEVLLEEYETHRPSGAGTDPAAPATMPRTLPKTLKEVAQPQISEGALETIAREGEAERARIARIESERERTEAEDSYNARLASDFFTLLTKAQRQKAEDALGRDNEALWEEYLDKLARAWESLPEGKRPGKPLEDYIELALAHEVYGFIDDLRERHWKETAYDTDAASRAIKTEHLAFNSWLTSIHLGEAAAARSKGKLTAEGAAAMTAQEARAAQAEEIATAGAGHQATPAAQPADEQEQQQQPAPATQPAAAEQTAEAESQAAADLLNLNDPEVLQAFARVLQTVVAAAMKADRTAASQTEPEREGEREAGNS
jgi:hypothetical protein